VTVSAPVPDLAEESFVVIEGTPLDWGARCQHLAAVMLEPEWEGEAPDAAAELGLAPPGGEAPVRVLLLRFEGGEVPLKVRARLSIEALPRARFCPLPTRVLGAGTKAFDGIVFFEQRRPLLVVNPAGLAARLGSLSPPQLAGPTPS
jgi:hypothetical protein